MKKYYKELVIMGIVILLISVLLLISEEKDWLFYIIDKKSYQMENVTIDSIKGERVGAGGNVVKRDFIYFEYADTTGLREGRLRKAFNDYTGKKITIGINHRGRCVRTMPIIPSMCGYCIEILVIFSLGVFLIVYGSLPHKEHKKDKIEIEKERLGRKITLIIRIITLFIVAVMILLFIK